LLLKADIVPECSMLYSSLDKERTNH